VADGCCDGIRCGIRGKIVLAKDQEFFQQIQTEPSPGIMAT